ncbi:MAG: hypothetical protein ACI84K_000810 [Pseudohongiellaceae bacterium]|jgi:hypothetical protein
MSKEIAGETEQRRKVIELQRNRWKAVIYGESATNIAKFERQVAKYGRIKDW